MALTKKQLQAHLLKRQRGYDFIARQRLKDVRKMPMEQKFDAVCELAKFAQACSKGRSVQKRNVDLNRRMLRAKAYYRAQEQSS